MKTLGRLLILALAVAAGFYFYRPPAVEAKQVEMWAGDEVSGCMVPISAIADGKNPAIWDNQPPRWNQFESKQAASDAGYRECPSG